MPEYDPKAYMEKLYLSDPLQDPLLRRVVEAAGLPVGSRGLDAGCGVGLQIPGLAEAVGPEGRVTGMDIRPEFLEEAGRNIDRWGLGPRVSLIQGDIYDPPFAEREFDWIWSASCACYSMSRPLELLEVFRRILEPGGQLLIVIWSAQQLLPGYPRLEAMLNATAAGMAPFTAEDPPDRHFLRLPGWLRKAGFLEVAAQPFSQGICAPFDRPIRDALLTLIEMRWPGAEEELSRADRLLYRRITDPDSPDLIVDLPDYYGFYTYTLFRGRNPA
ncbi:MAG: methyltransferase domain-containing protein [Spirochaetales bacterium]|nr:methyltransferase domain-containing protein [Spirochaetales bacterium]